MVPTTGLLDQTPDRGGYLGIHITNFAGVQVPTLDTIIDVAKELDIEVVPMAKEHIYENQKGKFPRFQEYFKEKKIPLNKFLWRVKCPDLWKVMLDCDAHVYPYVSTAILESALMKKPAIVVDLFKVNDRAKLYPNIKMVYSKKELRKELIKIKEMK